MLHTARFLTAAALYETGGQPFWTARSHLQAARAYPDHPGTDRLLTQAADTFAALGAVRAESRVGHLLADRS